MGACLWVALIQQSDGNCHCVTLDGRARERNCWGSAAGLVHLRCVSDLRGPALMDIAERPSRKHLDTAVPCAERILFCVMD